MEVFSYTKDENGQSKEYWRTSTSERPRVYGGRYRSYTDYGPVSQISATLQPFYFQPLPQQRSTLTGIGLGFFENVSQRQIIIDRQ